MAFPDTNVLVSAVANQLGNGLTLPGDLWYNFILEGKRGLHERKCTGQ